MITIRKARPDEWETIAGFQLRMASETERIQLDATVLGEGVRSVFAQPSKGFYLVAENKNQILGSLMVTYEWSDWRNRQIYWIQSVYVLPNFRNQGIYRSLYNYVVSLAEQSDEVGGIRLYVDRSNLAAQQVYSRLGMNGEHYQVFEWMKQ
jgi:ribosomal protein S18 acetylase RimI-like enzyme